jgi:uncharacterized membrane protein
VGLRALVSNGRLADVVLFGAFLAWAIVCFDSARKRDRAAGTVWMAKRVGTSKSCRTLLA